MSPQTPEVHPHCDGTSGIRQSLCFCFRFEKRKQTLEKGVRTFSGLCLSILKQQEIVSFTATWKHLEHSSWCQCVVKVCNDLFVCQLTNRSTIRSEWRPPWKTPTWERLWSSVLSSQTTEERVVSSCVDSEDVSDCCPPVKRLNSEWMKQETPPVLCPFLLFLLLLLFLFASAPSVQPEGKRVSSEVKKNEMWFHVVLDFQKYTRDSVGAGIWFFTCDWFF